jgi:hypothetical protein
MKREKAEKPNGMSYVIMRQAGNFFGDLLHCYENEQTRLEKSNDIAKDKLMWTNPKLAMSFFCRTLCRVQDMDQSLHF